MGVLRKVGSFTISRIMASDFANESRHKKTRTAGCPGGRGRRPEGQANCSSSVDPVRAVTEDWPDWITCVTSSK